MKRKTGGILLSCVMGAGAAQRVRQHDCTGVRIRITSYVSVGG